MKPRTWLLRRLAEVFVFVATVTAASALRTGGLDPAAGTTAQFVLYWSMYYGVFSGYWIISAILFATFRKSADPRVSPATDSAAFIVHSYAAASVMHGWPIGFGAGLDLRSPVIWGWGGVLLLHAVSLLRTLVMGRGARV